MAINTSLDERVSRAFEALREELNLHERRKSVLHAAMICAFMDRTAEDQRAWIGRVAGADASGNWPSVLPERFRNLPEQQDCDEPHGRINHVELTSLDGKEPARRRARR